MLTKQAIRFNHLLETAINKDRHCSATKPQKVVVVNLILHKYEPDESANRVKIPVASSLVQKQRSDELLKAQRAPWRIEIRVKTVVV